MIREMEESHLQGAPKAEIAEMVREHSDWHTARPSPLELEKAIAMIDRIRKLPPATRGIIASYLGTDELFCHKCGQTSCIHGYPDL